MTKEGNEESKTLVWMMSTATDDPGLLKNVNIEILLYPLLEQGTKSQCRLLWVQKFAPSGQSIHGSGGQVWKVRKDIRRS